MHTAISRAKNTVVVGCDEGFPRECRLETKKQAHGSKIRDGADTGQRIAQDVVGSRLWTAK